LLISDKWYNFYFRVANLVIFFDINGFLKKDDAPVSSINKCNFQGVIIDFFFRRKR